MIYGYANKKLSAAGLMELKEVTFGLRPAELRLLAQFLLESADMIEQGDLGTPGWHCHASDKIPGWRELVPNQDVIVSLDEATASSLSWEDVPRVADEE